jgi:hypothetical protein
MPPSPKPSIQYPPTTLTRAGRAIRCAPFRLPMYETMLKTGVSLPSISDQSGLQNHYTTKPLNELLAEADLLWLVQVGLLRREVDGQGLTDSFRVTPLGRQWVTLWQNGTRMKASSRDRLYNALSRWFRLAL